MAKMLSTRRLTDGGIEDESSELRTDDVVSGIQEATVSSSSVPKTCKSSSNCGNCVETRSMPAGATVQTEIETNTATHAVEQQVRALQATVDQLSPQMAQIPLIAYVLADVKKSMDCMMGKIDDLASKLDSLQLEIRQGQVTERLETIPNDRVNLDGPIVKSENGDKDPCCKSEVVMDVEVSEEKDKACLSGAITTTLIVLSTPPAASASPEQTASLTALPDTSANTCPKNIAVVKLPAPKNPEELNKRLIPPLKRVIELKVKYNETEAKQNKKIMMDTVESVVDAMKGTNPLFNDLYRRRGYTGSSYEGLRISEANEFDLNLVMQMPFSPDDVELEVASEPGFMHYRLKRELEVILGTHAKWTKDLYQQLLPFFEDRYFLRDKWQNWCQRVLAKAWDKVKNPEGVAKVTPHPAQCGPAITLKIYVASSEKSIDVDLVPVLDCAQFPMPAGLQKSKRFKKLSHEAQVWFLVPKRLKEDKFTLLEVKRCWRISFPEAEKALLDRLGFLKPLIKLFKLLRDVEKWPIASYFIKSLFLLELDQRCDLEYWEETNAGTRFMEMLDKFQGAMKAPPFIPYYFNRDANLLSGMNEKVANPISNRLGKLKKRLSDNPESIIAVFKAEA